MKSFLMLCVAILSVIGCAEKPGYRTLENSEIVCTRCTQRQLADETEGVREAALAFIEYVGGSNLMPEASPLTIHLDEDNVCPKNPDHLAYYTPQRNAICLFNLELHSTYAKDAAPFTELPSQAFMVHESLHAWFHGRLEFNYSIEEGFCRYVELDVSGIVQYDIAHGYNINPNLCAHLVPRTEVSYKLVNELCSDGLTSDEVRSILKELDKAATAKGAPLTAREFADLISEVTGRDSLPAFQSANIL